MERYIKQLLNDIAYASENVSVPFTEEKLEIHDWISDEDEDKTAPIRNLEDWTGIRKEQLPPSEMLSDEQLHLLFSYFYFLFLCAFGQIDNFFKNFK